MARMFFSDGKERPSSLPLMGTSFEAHSEEDLTLLDKEFARTSTYSNLSTNLEGRMGEQGTLLYCDEAVRFIEQISDPVTKALVNMAFVHLVKKVSLEKRDLPRSDLDMLYLVTTLKDYFSEHEVIARTLEGEKVGAWFDDEP